MRLHLKRSSAFVARATGAGLAAILLPAPLLAQTAGEQPKKVDKIEVTGSNIKRIDTETPAPVTIITREEIQSSGKQTVAELLRTLPINAAGGLNDLTGTNSFSSGASSVSLRGLGSAATLVLLNGRRIAPYGLANPNFGQSSAVNTDSLPLDVVDRIEILKDGASAIYGSEAIAGVINIILRKDFRGALVSSSYSINKDSEYQTWRATGTIGYGDLAKDKYNFFLNVEHYDRERTAFRDVDDFLNRPVLENSGYATGRRLFSSYADRGNYYQAVFDPATLGNAFYFARITNPTPDCVANGLNARDAAGACRYDIWTDIDLIPKSVRDNFFARGTIDFSPTLSGFGEASYNKIKTTYSSPPQVYGDFGSYYSSTLQRLVNIPEVLPVGHPNNPFDFPVGLRHRFTEVGPTTQISESEAVRFVGGLKGTWKNLDWESAVTYSSNEPKVTNINQIRTSAITAGILNGTYNFLDPSAGALKPADIKVDTVDNGKSSFTIFDIKGSTEIFQTPNGPIGMAVGYEYRREKFETRPDPLKEQGEIVGFGASSADGSRNVNSAFIEFSVPILKTLEAQLAARTDKYQDFGRSTTPKVGLKWKALPTLALRANYSEGFRAPSLTEISKSSVTAFTTVTDPKRCITGDEDDCFRTIAALLEANPNVKPEESKSHTLGAIWEPKKDLSFALDFFYVKRENEISLLDLNQILANEDNPNPPYPGRVIRGAVPPGEQVGQLQAVRTFFSNFGKTEVKGYDLDIRYLVNLGANGKVRFTGLVTYYESFRGSLDKDAPVVEFIGFRNVPRVRAQAGANWEFQEWNVGVTGNYTGKFRVSSDPAVSCEQASLLGTQGFCEVNAFETADVNVDWKGIKNLTLGLVIRNVTSKRPPLDPLERPSNLFWHEPYGRYFTMFATYAFK